MTRTYATNAESQDISLANVKSLVTRKVPKEATLVVTSVDQMVLTDAVVMTADRGVIRPLDATDATRPVTLPDTAKKSLSDATDAITQVIWPRIVRTRSKVDHAITVARLVIYNVNVNRQVTNHATNVKTLVI